MPDWQVIEGDCVEQMAAMGEESVDAVVCDPPYGLEFMGKSWDRLGGGADVRQPFRGEVQTPDNPYGRTPVRYGYDNSPRAMQTWHEAWAREALRVLKPGAYLVAAGGSRTYHRLTCAIEDAGFEIRDCIAWLYGSGFPKSLDVSKAIDAQAGATREVVGHGNGGLHHRANVTNLSKWDTDHDADGHPITAPATPDAERWQGWGTALKPAHEPVVVARKLLSGTVAANVLAHGTGALNVDGCRIGTEGGGNVCPGGDDCKCDTDGRAYSPTKHPVRREGEFGRWPANVVLDPEAAAMLDEQTPDLQRQGNLTHGAPVRGGGSQVPNVSSLPVCGYGDSGGASRFFYCAKASSAERNAGLDGFEKREGIGQAFKTMGDLRMDREQERRLRRNVHPTVKPIDLMRWLVRLVTPPGGLVLDPFAGSGTTGIAASLEGFRFLGIEREPEYAAIARARIAWWAEHPDGVEIVKALEAERTRAKVRESGQMGLFGS